MLTTRLGLLLSAKWIGTFNIYISRHGGLLKLIRNYVQNFCKVDYFAILPIPRGIVFIVGIRHL